jgi:hypothetical protein
LELLKLLVVIAFHFNEKKLHYLKRLLDFQPFITQQVECVITTNTSNPEEISKIKRLEPKAENYKLEVIGFPTLPHPWLLPWAHKQVMLSKFKDPSYTHFVYTEDDIAFTKINFDYWLWARKLLRDYGLYPSFIRVEFSNDQKVWNLSDQDAPIDAGGKEKIILAAEGMEFFCLPNPYQGLFLYDRELMEEHIHSQTFDVTKYGRIEQIDHNPAWPGGGVAERANFGITFQNVPKGFTSRNVVGVRTDLKLLDVRAFVHHLPNNYANDKPELKLGKFSALQQIIN